MPSKHDRLIDLIDDMTCGKDVFFRWVRFVKDIMTREVKTLALDDTIKTCLKFMEKNRIRHVPIVDKPTGQEEKPYLLGVVSDRDILRLVSPYLGKIGETDSDSRAVKQTLMQIMTRNPLTVSPETPIVDAAITMTNKHINMLPVLSEQNLVGVLTSTDILMLFIRLDLILRLHPEGEKKRQRKNIIDAICRNSQELTFQVSSMLQAVGDVMTEQVVTLEEQESVGRALEVMEAGNFRHLPIVGSTKKLAGLISNKDILRHLQYNRRQLQSKTNEVGGGLFDAALNDPVLKQPVGHIMSHKVTHVRANDDFYAAVKTLYEKKISCLPVVDEEKRVVGIFTNTDVIRGLLAIYVLAEKAMSEKAEV